MNSTYNRLEKARYGICIKPDRISAAAAAGYDYVEMDLRDILSMNGSAWLAMAGEMQRCNIRAEVLSGLLPADVPIIGTEVSAQKIHQALQRSFEAAKLLGAELMVFDCERQRILPARFDPAMAWRQLGNFIRILQSYASDHSLHIALLPLRRSAADLMNYVTEATLISAMLHLDRVGVAASSYNMAMEAESMPQLKRTGSLLWHMRVSNALGNRLPHRNDGENYRFLMETLYEMEYGGRISCEGGWRNFEIDAAEALICLKDASKER